MTDLVADPRVIEADAPIYNARPSLTCGYYTYWSGLPMDGMETVIRPDRGWGAFPTNDGLTLLVLGWPYPEASAYKADPEGNYLERFGPYFTDRYTTPWGKAINFDGPGSDEVRGFFIDNALMWPFVSMIRQMQHDGRARRVVFLNGVSYAHELGYRDIVEGWERSREFPITYVPTVSRPDDPANAEWTGRTGRVEMILDPVLDELGLAPADSIAYICGNPDMIISAEETLLGRGYPEEQIHKELYWPKGKEPRGMAAVDIAAAIDAAEANADQ